MGFGALLVLISWIPLPQSGPALAGIVRDGDLIGVVQVENPWCGGSARFKVTLTNVGSHTLWLTLEEPPGDYLYLRSYFYSHDQGMEGVGGGVACGGEGPFGFLEGTTAVLLPEQPKTWHVRLPDLEFHQGRGTVKMTIGLDGTSDRGSDQLRAFSFPLVVDVSLRRAGLCFRATPRVGDRPGIAADWLHPPLNSSTLYIKTCTVRREVGRPHLEGSWQPALVG
jgi:hypothetical protein